jgi:putative chitinase
MIPVDADFIRAVAPRYSGPAAAAQERIVRAIGGSLAAVLGGHGIDTPLRIAHFMGQVTHECAGFRTTEEFASGAAYEGRMDLGNTQPGDGRRYKGRGLIQLTGRANYREIGGRLGLDLEGNPALAADPLTSLRIACEYWTSRRINEAADEDDLLTVTRRVNGGLNGLEERRAYLDRARAALAGLLATLVHGAEGGTAPVLRRGSFSDQVGELQRRLRARGFLLAVDNDFGPATELAVKSFQARGGLVVDGIVGRATWGALT